MKAIIPTGGRGTRMRPLTFSTNKHFIPVANKPLIYYPIESVVEAGITDIAITYNPPNLELVRDFLGDGSRFGAKFTFVEQPEPKGLAHIYKVCEKFINGEEFVVHLGDNIFTEGIKEAVAYFTKNKPDGLVTMVHHPENFRLGVPEFDSKGRLIKYVEKPVKPATDYAIPGLYFFGKHAFEPFNAVDGIQASARGEYEIPDAYQWLIDHEYRIDVIEYKGTWLDPGKFGDWIETNHWLLEHKLISKVHSPQDKDTILDGIIEIGHNCEIINTQIRGPVSIGDNVVLNNCIIGPYTAIANNCVIEGSSIENSVVLDSVKIINVNEDINGSLIGSKSEIVQSNDPGKILKMFIGEKCLVQI